LAESLTVFKRSSPGTTHLPIRGRKARGPPEDWRIRAEVDK